MGTHNSNERLGLSIELKSLVSNAVLTEARKFFAAASTVSPRTLSVADGLLRVAEENTH